MLAMLGAYVFDTVREGVDLASKVDAKRAYLRNRQLLNERVSISCDCVALCCRQVRVSVSSVSCLTSILFFFSVAPRHYQEYLAKMCRDENDS